MVRAFDDMEGLRIAQEMERRGVELYRRAQRICSSERALKLLRRLEKEEMSHQAEFARLYEERARGGEAAPVLDVEQSAYLSALAADIVFPGGLVQMSRESGLDNPISILRHAIQAEKDSLLFYGAIMEQSRDERARETLCEIIGQERSHLAELTQTLSEEEGA